jgi:hypothetical protein
MTQTNKENQPLPDMSVDPIAIIAEVNDKIRESGYELVLRQIPTRDVVAFDFGMVFTKDSADVGIYADDLLADTMKSLANEHGQVFIKVNWFSPDVMVITPADNPDPLRNTEDTDTAASLPPPVSLPEALTEPIAPPAVS